jgi:acrylyl-CoA reductase (NADPH)
MCPLSVRREAWKRLSTDLERGKLQTMTNEIQLPGVLVAAPAILDGRIRGRIVVKIQ